MLTKFRPKTTLLIIGLLAILLYGWLQLAPTALGGKVSYLVVEGQSMEPVFTAGDLVLARPAEDYDVDDIIAYRSDLLDVTVMHRVIERGPGTFTTQGDNNSWIDEYQPTRYDILGVPFTHVPKAGIFLIWASRPINAALLLCVGGLVSFGGVFAIRKRRAKRGPDGVRRRPQPTGLRGLLRSQRIFTGPLRSFASEEENTAPESTRAPPEGSNRKNPFQMLLMTTVAGLIPTLLLGACALTQPTTRLETTRSTYQQSSEFTYTGRVSPGPVYTETPLKTGEPIFRQLVSSFDVYFDYELSAAVPHFISGTGQLVIEVSEQSGWKRAFALGPETGFDSNALRLEGSVDLALIDQLIEDFKTLTGIPRETYLLSIQANMAVDGTVAGQPCCDPVQPPTVYFLLDPLQILPSADGQGIVTSPEQFTKVDLAEIEAERVLTNRLGFLSLSISVSAARSFGWAAAALISACVTLLVVLTRRDPGLNESARIKSTYGPMLIDVKYAAPSIQGTNFRTTDMKSLVQMAEKLDLTILHSQSGPRHTYLLHDGSVVYSYETEDLLTMSDAEDHDAQAAAS